MPDIFFSCLFFEKSYRDDDNYYSSEAWERKYLHIRGLFGRTEKYCSG